MGTGVGIEVDTMDAAARSTILKHALGAITEWQDAHTGSTDGCRGGYIIHLGIRDTAGQHIAANPGIEDTCAVDAEQYAKASLQVGMVDMGKGIDTRLGVIVDIAQHTIHHTRSAGRRGYLTWIEHAQ